MEDNNDFELGSHIDEFQNKLLIPLLNNTSFLLRDKKDKNRGLPRYGVTKRPFNMVNMLHLLSANDSDKKMYLGRNQAERMGGILKEGAEPELLQFWKTRDVDADGVEFSLERPVAVIVPVYNTALDFEDGTLPESMTQQFDNVEFDLDTAKKYLVGRYFDNQGNAPDLDYINDMPLDLQKKEIINRLDLFHIEALVTSPLGSKEYVAEMMSVQMLNYVVGENLGIEDMPKKDIFHNGFINLVKNDVLTAMTAINNADDYMAKLHSKALLGPNKVNDKEKVFLNVSYADRGEAKEKGARWDGDSNKWFVNANADLSAFKKWMPVKSEVAKVDTVSFPKYSTDLDMDVFVNKVLLLAQERQQFVFEKLNKESLEISVTRLKKAQEIGMGNNEKYKKTAHSLCQQVYESLGYTTKKLYLDVPLEKKDKAKEMGGKWDRKEQSWFIPVGTHKEKLLNVFEERKGQPIYLDIDFKTRSIAKENGARWDASVKSWYFFGEELPLELKPYKKEATQLLNESDIDLPDRDFGIPDPDFNMSEPDIGIPDRDFGIPDPDFNISEPNIGVPVSDMSVSESTDYERIYLSVSYDEREDAKQFGARWDGDKKSWYYEGGALPNELNKYKPENVERQQVSAMPASEEFRQYLQENGFNIGSDTIQSGVSGRVSVPGDKNGKKSGFYVFHDNPTGIAGGFATNNRTQERLNWSSSTGQGRERLSEAEIARIKQLQAQRDKDRELERKRVQKETTKTIHKELGYAKEADKGSLKNEYLERKKVGYYSGVFINNNNNSLLIPAKNIEGEVMQLQYINKDGSKIFKKGGQKMGAFHIIDENNINHKKMEKQFIIAEGYATGASIYEATGGDIPVVVSFDSGNLVNVGKLLADKYPDAQIIVACDNDVKLETNPHVGFNVGRKAGNDLKEYASNRIAIAVPFFTSNEVEKGYTDFNDMVSLGDNKKEVALTAIKNTIKSASERMSEAIVQNVAIQKSLEKKQQLELKKRQQKGRSM